MKAVLTCRLSSGEVIEVHPFMFAKVDFTDSEVVSGDKYYIDKAVSLGAKKKPRAKKAKSE